MDGLLERLRRIDQRLAELPAGAIEVHPRGGDRVAFRVRKEGARSRFERVGPEGGPEHREALALLEERRNLSRERRDLAREAHR